MKRDRCSLQFSFFSLSLSIKTFCFFLSVALVFITLFLLILFDTCKYYVSSHCAYYILKCLSECSIWFGYFHLESKCNKSSFFFNRNFSFCFVREFWMCDATQVLTVIIHMETQSIARVAEQYCFGNYSSTFQWITCFRYLTTIQGTGHAITKTYAGWNGLEFSRGC